MRLTSLGNLTGLINNLKSLSLSLALISDRIKHCVNQGCIVIIKKLVVGPFASNCYIVSSELTKEGMIIDPGDEARQILKGVKNWQLDIKFIVVTHGHIDHIGAVREVKEATGAEVGIHANDAPFLQGQQVNMGFGSFYQTPLAADRLLKGGDNINAGDLHFLVLHTPGHSPGGICLLGQGVLFTGDTLFNCGIGRADLPGGSHSQLLSSIHTKLMILPDDTIVYPGHGPETTIGAERRANPFLR